MTNCMKCKAALADGAVFCGSCGAPQAQPVAAGVAPLPPQSSTVAAQNTGLTTNLAAALCYALGLITGILFLVLEPYKSNRFVRFHAMQSILFSAACIVIGIVWSIAVDLLVNVAGFWVLTIDVPLHLLFGLGIFLLWLYLMFQAYSQREFRLPIIGSIAARQLG